MPKSISLIVVEKNGVLRSLTVKDYKEEELYKKCNFKKSEGFIIQNEWSTKFNGQKYTIVLYAKSDGKAGTENKYEFPPPVDSKLFFGACILLGYLRDDSGERSLFNLTIPLWSSIYEKLFGGFDTLKETIKEDEDEEDELESFPKDKKTKAGYLKNDFVVDSGSDAETYYSESDSSDIYDSKSESNDLEETEELILEDIGSELSEESYDYSDEDDK
jgi:hypothetical protein